MARTWHVVARREEIPPGGRKLVVVEGREIGLFDVEGRLYAVRNRCPDQGGPVCRGGLFERFDAEVLPNGRVREFVTDRGYILACPWHGWEYDIRTGVCLWDPRYRVATYPVRVDEDGNVSVEL